MKLLVTQILALWVTAVYLPGMHQQVPQEKQYLSFVLINFKLHSNVLLQVLQNNFSFFSNSNKWSFASSWHSEHSYQCWQHEAWNTTFWWTDKTTGQCYEPSFKNSKSIVLTFALNTCLHIALSYGVELGQSDFSWIEFQTTASFHNKCSNIDSLIIYFWGEKCKLRHFLFLTIDHFVRTKRAPLDSSFTFWWTTSNRCRFATSSACESSFFGVQRSCTFALHS